MTGWYGYNSYNYYTSKTWAEREDFGDWYQLTHNASQTLMRLFIWVDKIFSIMVI